MLIFALIEFSMCLSFAHCLSSCERMNEYFFSSNAGTLLERDREIIAATIRTDATSSDNRDNFPLNKVIRVSLMI